MTSSKWIVAGLCLALLAPEAAAKTGKAGSSSGVVLRMGSGARGPAMGNAYTAEAEGLAAMSYNPAGLGFTSRAQVGAMYQNYILDIQQGELGFTHPINSVSSWGVSAHYLDYGATKRVTLNDIINDNITATTFTGRDIVIGASYGRQIAEPVSIGLTAKVVNQEIDNLSATAIAADVGVEFAPKNIPVRIGIVGQNFGTKIRFERDRENLPSLVRGGASVNFFQNRFTLSADVEKVRQQNVTFGVGGEYRFMDMFAVRLGYDGRIDADNGLTAGLGVKVSDFSVDYAYLPMGKLGNNHRLSLLYNFGPDYKR